MAERTLRSKTLIIQWVRGDACVNSTFIWDTVEGGLESSVDRRELTNPNLLDILYGAFGQPEPTEADKDKFEKDHGFIRRGVDLTRIESPTTDIYVMKEEIVEALVRRITRKLDGPVVLAINEYDLNIARKGPYHAHFHDINGGILLTIE